MTRMRRVRVAAPLFALAAGLAFWLGAPAALAVARQDAPPPPVEVGAGPVRERSLGVTGRNVYGPDSVQVFGYLSSIIGLDPSQVFTDATHSERSARFTYAGAVSISSRIDRGDVTTFAGDGVMQIYLDDAGASWDDPGSFGDGLPLAEFSIHLRDTLHRQAPGVGVLVGDGQLTQMTAAEFSLDGARYRFGNVGIEQRLRSVGALVGGAAAPPVLAVSLTGSASVTVREAIPVDVGQPAATAAAATPAAQTCPELQPWLGQTIDVLTQAQTLGAVAENAGDVSSLDEEGVRQAAAELVVLAEAQRATAAPDAAVAANRLVLTALSTYARGLEVIATASAEQDSALLAQGQSVVTGGSQLRERAAGEIATLVSACEERPAPAEASG